jgi:signal transduction histidine kinase
VATCDRNELREVSAAVLAVTAHLSVREVLQTIVAAARRLLDAQYAALGIPDGNGSFREFLADGLSDEQWRAIGPIPRQHGLLGAMLRDPNPVRSADIRKHPRFEGWPASHPEMVDFLGMPIVDGDQILGELFLANKRARQKFDADDEELLKLLAGHAAIAIVNARLYERSRELSIVEERQRIARELHDAVTQKLFSLRLTAEAAAELVGRDPRRAAAELDVVRRLAADATAELKSIVVGLRPVDLAGDGLAPALAKQAELLDRVHDARVTFAADQQVPRLSADREEAAYRVAQEALHNALRHGAPKHVTIELRRAGPGVVLTIGDDGQGFEVTTSSTPNNSTPNNSTADNSTPNNSTAHNSTADNSTANSRAQHRLGLASMRERARTVGGRLQVTSKPGQGTTITLEVPGG